MDTDNKPVKKKRGRKPKENIIVNDNPIFANDNDNIENLIVKLNKNKDNNINILCSIDEYEYELNKKYEQFNVSELCWNCCHKFNGFVTGLPLKYNNDIFYTIGDFCSLECCSRYAFEKYNNKIYEIMPIINMYNNIKYDKHDKINMAPDKLVLIKFGGKLTIDEYRKNFNSIYYINTPIIIPVSNNIYNYEFKYNNNNIKDLKLYRKKELTNEKNSIFNKMNLDIS
jgi:hypothetical protein